MYLEESRKAQRKEKKIAKSKKTKKKSKKGKTQPDSHTDSDSDDATKPIHVVNTTIEMPEGAVASDTDDKNDFDPNDPHRALNIDLDAEEDFYNPPAKPSKRIEDPVKSTNKVREKSKKKKKDNDEPVLLMNEGTENHHKDKKKHKRKKDAAPEVDLLQSEATPAEVKKSKKKSKDDKEKSDKSKKHKKSSKKESEHIGQAV